MHTHTHTHTLIHIRTERQLFNELCRYSLRISNYTSDSCKHTWVYSLWKTYWLLGRSFSQIWLLTHYRVHPAHCITGVYKQGRFFCKRKVYNALRQGLKIVHRETNCCYDDNYNQRKWGENNTGCSKCRELSVSVLKTRPHLRHYREKSRPEYVDSDDDDDHVGDDDDTKLC